MNELTRTCRKCGVVGDLGDFKAGANICKSCNKAYMAEYREKHRAHLNNIINDWRKKEKEKKRNVLNILIIDNDPAVFETLFKNFVKEFGDLVDVSWARDGFEGGQKILEIKPQLVFLNLTTPGIDGFETCRRIKKADPKCHVIALTAHNSPEDIPNVIKSQADLCLAKPLDISRIIELVRYLSAHSDKNRIFTRFKGIIHPIVCDISAKMHIPATTIARTLISTRSLKVADAILCRILKREDAEYCMVALRGAIMDVMMSTCVSYGFKLPTSKKAAIDELNAAAAEAINELAAEAAARAASEIPAVAPMMTEIPTAGMTESTVPTNRTFSDRCSRPPLAVERPLESLNPHDLVEASRKRLERCRETIRGAEINEKMSNALRRADVKAIQDSDIISADTDIESIGKKCTKRPKRETAEIAVGDWDAAGE